MLAILRIKRLLVVPLLHPPNPPPPPPYLLYIFCNIFFKKNYALQVPFGGAAFFPGRLIHTNELMV
jgi:hypothetical protein